MRLREAFKIVERHKFYAGLGGLFPIPAMNVAGVTAINLRMVKRLSDLYESAVRARQEPHRSCLG